MSEVELKHQSFRGIWYSTCVPLLLGVGLLTQTSARCEGHVTFVLVIGTCDFILNPFFWGVASYVVAESRQKVRFSLLSTIIHAVVAAEVAVAGDHIANAQTPLFASCHHLLGVATQE